MKKIITMITVLVMTGAVFAQRPTDPRYPFGRVDKNQHQTARIGPLPDSVQSLPNGSIAPDFTFVDMSGDTVHLYALIAQGKTVFIPVFATWAGPCWTYHNTGAMQQL